MVSALEVDALITRPNILHIFTDQQRFDTIAALGNPVIKTPSLDRLARMGVAFTNAYTPSPVCVAARCSMITGQYPTSTDCWNNGEMPTDRESFMDALARVGYDTHGVGKCHFMPDARALRGFAEREFNEELLGQGRAAADYLSLLADSPYSHCYEPHGVRGEMYYIPQPSRLPSHMHPTQWVGDRSVAYIEGQRAGKPWYLFSSFIHPHPPFTPPVPWHKLYRAAEMPLPNVPKDADALMMTVNKIQNRYKYRDQGIDLNLLRCMKAYYYACISFVDFQVGRLLDTLEKTGQLDNTLILFSSDHGEHLGDYNCFGKRSMHDSCARIPFLVYQRGLFEGGVCCDAPVSLVDVAPTFLGRAGASFRTHAPDGVDALSLFRGSCDRDAVFSMKSYATMAHMIGCDLSAYQNIEKLGLANYMVATREHKYAFDAAGGREFLFNKRTDPLETRNRAGVLFEQPARDALRTRLNGFLRQNGCEAILDGDGFRRLPALRMPEDPDQGLLIQDVRGDWFDERLPGYNC